MLVHQYAGILLRKMNRPDEAMVELRRTSELIDAMMKTHPGDAPTLSRLVRNERELAGIFASRGDAAGALFHAQRGLDSARRYLDGPESGLRGRYLADAYFGMASVHHTLKHWPQARDYAQQAIAQWADAGVKDSDATYREQAAAILAESTAHLGK